MTNYLTKISFVPETLPLGIDTADVNGAVDIHKGPALAFGGVRCGEGLYRDKLYAATRAQYERDGLPVIAYFVLYPGQPVAQSVANFKSWAGSGCYGYSWDLEVKNGQSTSRISQDTRDVTLALLDAGYKVINYTTAAWINQYFRSPTTHLLPDWVGKAEWWLAQYVSGREADYIYVPNGLDLERVLIAQTWNQAPNEYGSKYDSVYVDRDRWLRGYPGATAPAEDSMPQESLTETRRMTVSNKSGLNVRAKPAAGDTQILTWLPDGSKVDTTEKLTIGLDIWRKRSQGGYVAELYNGFRYLK